MGEFGGGKGLSVKCGRSVGCGLPSLALGTGIRAGTTDIPVVRAVRHSGLDAAGIQGWAGVIGQTWAVYWLRGTVLGTGSRHPAGTTDIAVGRAVRHSGLDAGIQGRAGVIG